MDSQLAADVAILDGSSVEAPIAFGSTEQALGGTTKRAFDITLAVTILVIMLPIMAIVATLVWWHDGRSPFFAHRRLGRGGRFFPCLKFRSMVHDAAARDWLETQKLRNDPRITPIGRLLRVSSLDELPQLLNVIMGDMSIVGPRPIVPAEIDRYGADYGRYSACRPGMTGLWQISGRGDCTYAERVRLDVQYANCWSFWRDVVILVKTLPAVLAQKGSC